MKKRSTTLKMIGLTLAGLGAVVSTGAVSASEMHTKSEGGLMVYNPSDSAYWFSVGGRLNLDETVFSGGFRDKRNQFASGGDIRRAFLKFAGGVGEYISYNITLDFARFNGDDSRGQTGSSVQFEDAYINACSEYTGAIGVTNLRFGQFTPPTSIDDWGNYGTENDNMFLESALATSAFAIPTKVLGVWFDTTIVDMFMFSASAFQPAQNTTNSPIGTGTGTGFANNNNYGDTGRSDRMGGAMRLTFAPVHNCDTVYHLGVMGRYQSMNQFNGNTAVNGPINQSNLFRTTPEARARQTGRLVNTGNIRARSYNVVSAEGLAMWGPATVEAEYYQANVQRVPTASIAASRDNPRFHGWHVEAAYMLTGEHRVYDFQTGTLRNPKICDKTGAWEVAARYSFLNMTDKNVYGGSEHNATLGLNWFVNNHVKVSANYIRANIHPTGNPAGSQALPVSPTNPNATRELDIVGLRFAVAF